MSQMLDFARSICQATREVTGDGVHDLHVPCLDNADKTALSNCIETGYVSSAGNEISKFEEDLKKYTGSDYAIAVNSGTSALHLSLIAAGVNSSHEVLVPSLTFVATGNAVLYTGASTHFVDSHEEGFGVDPLKLREHLFKNTTRNQNRETVNPKTGKKIKVLIVTHVFGHIGFINELKQVCDEFDIALVEDAAEALGSSQAETHAGLFGLCGAISFNGNKIITTGAGGCVLTNNAEVAHHIRHLSSTAKIAHRYEFVHDQLGYNYRMPNLNASLGISQLGRLPTFLRAKALLLNAYKNSFSNINGVRVYEHNELSRSNYWLQTILLDQPDELLQRLILEEANQAGLGMRPVWKPLHKLPVFEEACRMDLTVTENLAHRIINVPSSCYLMTTSSQPQPIL